MDIRQSVSLKAFNTFGIEASAAAFARFDDVSDLSDLLENIDREVFILGGGSNMLLVEDLDCLVLKNEIGGIDIIHRENGKVLIEAGGGVNWHSFVSWAVEKHLGGVENLALIPGTVGAAPIQNIGAYGVELREVFHSLDTVEISSGVQKSFNYDECDFGYRNSIFKQQEKGKHIITKVRMWLNEEGHILNTSYGAIAETLEQERIAQPGVNEVFQAVIRIRQSKLPDPAVIGNSGSFFKNPEVNEETFSRLEEKFSDLIFYPMGESVYKIPAGWMIEKCGWKGRRRGDAGCYEKQALVLVNYGNATGREIYQLALDIQASVEDTFGIRLHPEVNILGGDGRLGSETTR